MDLLLSYLRQARGTRIYKRWFSGLKLFSVGKSHIVFTAPSPQLAEDITLIFGNGILLEAVKLIWPEVVFVRIKPAAILPLRNSNKAQLHLELMA